MGNLKEFFTTEEKKELFSKYKQLLANLNASLEKEDIRKMKLYEGKRLWLKYPFWGFTSRLLWK